MRGGRIPWIATDFDGVRLGVQAGAGFGTGPRDAMARLWRRLWCMLEGSDRSQRLAERITWMSSHTSLGAAASSVKSDGRPITEVDWRGNRLADGAAKQAAS